MKEFLDLGHIVWHPHMHTQENVGKTGGLRQRHSGTTALYPRAGTHSHPGVSPCFHRWWKVKKKVCLKIEKIE